MFSNKPVLGYGLDNFSTYIRGHLDNEFQRLTRINANPAYAHNIFIDKLATTGFVGFSMFSYFVFSVFKKIKIIFSRTNEARLFYLGISSGFVAILIRVYSVF